MKYTFNAYNLVNGGLGCGVGIDDKVEVTVFSNNDDMAIDKAKQLIKRDYYDLIKIKED